MNECLMTPQHKHKSAIVCQTIGTELHLAPSIFLTPVVELDGVGGSKKHEPS